MTKPVVAYVAGFTAPEGKTMGHAGAIISGSAGTAQAKKEALEKVGRPGRPDPQRDRPAGPRGHAVGLTGASERQRLSVALTPGLRARRAGAGAAVGDSARRASARHGRATCEAWAGDDLSRPGASQRRDLVPRRPAAPAR